MAIGVFVFIVFFAVNGFRFSQNLNFKRDIVFVLGTMMVGLFEEISLRGFYLQVLESRMGFLKANILSSLMFACLHAVTLLKSSENMMLSLIMFMIISLWLGYIFKKTKLLWVPIIVHALYNLIVYMT